MARLIGLGALFVMLTFPNVVAIQPDCEFVLSPSTFGLLTTCASFCTELVLRKPVPVARSFSM